MRALIFLILLIISTITLRSQAYIDPQLLALKNDSFVGVIIVLDQVSDLTQTKNIKGKTNKADFVYKKLLSHTESTQKSVQNFLKTNNIPFRSYYIVNILSLKADKKLIAQLATLKEVKMILKDGTFILEKAEEDRGNGDRSVEWGISRIKAPQVWAQGFKGQGVVIGGQDTGYEWYHSQLQNKYRGWNGSSADHNFNWHDAIHEINPANPNMEENMCGLSSPIPCDDHNHGTHTMGTMVGHSGIDTIGVAPEAKWIGCRNMERGYGMLSTYIECFEWFLAPYPYGQGPEQGDPSKSPHVINNSWACPAYEGCNPTNIFLLELALNNLRNSGCVIVASNGNSGSSGCSTTLYPPGFFENSFSVGATNSSNVIANFSSKGPVTYDGSNRLKPDVSAPGVNIRSSIRNGLYFNYSGTSMAGPHVAGAVALIISANPNLAGEVEQIEAILEQTTMPLSGGLDCGGISNTAIPNNTYGYGLINVEAAVARARNDFFVPIIKVDQFGYRPDDTKLAILSNPQTGYNQNDSFNPVGQVQLKNSVTHAVVFSGNATAWNGGATHSQSGDKVWWFDFTNFTTPGQYYVANGNIRSEDFVIEKEVYDEVLKTAFKTFYYQRCGITKVSPYALTGFEDEVCHTHDLNCRFIGDPNNASLWKDMSGGWHDAGDYNKYVNFAYSAVLDLQFSYQNNPEAWASDSLNITESGNSIPDLLDEIKYELDWLQKMQDTIDGGVYSVVGVQNFASASPPSSDNANRFYGNKSTSASFSAAAMMAFAAVQFKKINTLEAQNYQTSLLSKAIQAYNWGVSNPNVTYYNAGILAAGEQEVNNYERNMRRLCAAVYLYAATQDISYKNYVESNYTNSNFKQWNYVYPFENTTQLSLLYFAHIPGVSASVKNDIINTFRNSIDFSAENFPAHNNHLDAYRAYLSDANHVWGSNQWKTNMANNFLAYHHYGLDVTKNESINSITGGYLHYIHGVNPNGLCYLTNMSDKGAFKSINTIYHGWFTDGSSLWDDVRTSTYGPAPGFMAGGVNPSFNLDGCCATNSCGASNSLCITLEPPRNQPILKSYRDWNSSWPQNSWEITENAIYYQSSYLHLLSSKVNLSNEGANENPKVIVENGDFYFDAIATSVVLKAENGNFYKIDVNNVGVITSSLVDLVLENNSHVIDAHLQIKDNHKGLILRSPNNNIWKIFVGNDGSLTTQLLNQITSTYAEKATGNLYISDENYGLILKDFDGICYVLVVNDNGSLFTKPMDCGAE